MSFYQNIYILIPIFKFNLIQIKYLSNSKYEKTKLRIYKFWKMLHLNKYECSNIIAPFSALMYTNLQRLRGVLWRDASAKEIGRG